MTIDTERLKTDAAYWDEVDVTKGKATHYCTQGGGFCTPDHIRHCDIPRPTKPAAPEWDGEGLPTVGVECEVRFPLGLVEAKSVHFTQSGICVCETVEGDVFHSPNPEKFRPIRTKEQREREELSKLVREAYLEGASEHVGGLIAITDAILSRYNLEPKP